MNRNQLMEGLRSFGVDAPHIPSEDLDDEAIAGVLRWAKDQNRKGRPADSGLIVKKLLNGGLAGYGTSVGASAAWWGSMAGRERWMAQNVPDLELEPAETAIISLTQQKREPTEPLVREWADLAEAQDVEHKAACRASAQAQMKKKVEAPPGGMDGPKKVDGKKALA